jgi:hypothetical protein
LFHRALFRPGILILPQSAKEAVTMSNHTRKISVIVAVLMTALGLIALAAMPGRSAAQNAAPAKAADSSTSKDRWLHVRVENPDRKEETVRVNVPLELAEKILPTINKDRLHNGKVTVDKFDNEGVDVRALLDAVRESKDGEFVTVQSRDCDVRVAKQNNYMLIHVYDSKKPSKKSRVEVKVPMSVVNALFSAGKDELDLVAGLRALGASGDTELVSVKDEENTVRVWLDSKNVSE